MWGLPLSVLRRLLRSRPGLRLVVAAVWSRRVRNTIAVTLSAPGKSGVTLNDGECVKSEKHDSLRIRSYVTIWRSLCFAPVVGRGRNTIAMSIAIPTPTRVFLVVPIVNMAAVRPTNSGLVRCAEIGHADATARTR